MSRSLAPVLARSTSTNLVPSRSRYVIVPPRPLTAATTCSWSESEFRAFGLLLSEAQEHPEQQTAMKNREVFIVHLGFRPRSSFPIGGKDRQYSVLAPSTMYLTLKRK